LKDKLGIIIGIVIIVLVLGTLSLYLMNAGDIDLGVISLVGIVVILVAFALIILQDKIKSVNEGLPAEDERTKLVNYKAGYFGFIAAIWSSVFGPLFMDIFFDRDLQGGQVTAIVVIISGFVFVISYLYLTKKGDV
jgi:Na+/melibiose symporter-like transporter